MSLDVAVLMGGPSAEAEVSRASAAQIAEALESAGHTVTCYELGAASVPLLAQTRPDVVFPALHGPPGEDGTVQGMLDLLDLPYVGSGVHGAALAMDKSVAKAVFAQHGLPILDEVIVSPDDDLTATAAVIAERYDNQVVVKTLNQGSAIGVAPLPDGGDVAGALTNALAHGRCLVEPFFVGREITVGVLATEGRLIPHPVIEIVTADDEWYDYTNRYTEGRSRHLVPAPLPPEVSERLQTIAVTAHAALGLDDLSRADFIVNENGRIVLLEVNTLPGMTPTSLYPDGARELGYDFPTLIDLLVRQAHARGPRFAADS